MPRRDPLHLVDQLLAAASRYLVGGAWEVPEQQAVLCEEIDAERRRGGSEHQRYYAHVEAEDEPPDGVGLICFGTDVGKLEPEQQAGIVLHELGHVLTDYYEFDPTALERKRADDLEHPGDALEEARANAAVREVFDIEISYGEDDQVQRISKEDLAWLLDQ